MEEEKLAAGVRYGRRFQALVLAETSDASLLGALPAEAMTGGAARGSNSFQEMQAGCELRLVTWISGHRELWFS